MNLENVEAHLKVSRASEAVFCSSISWQRWSSCCGIEEEEEYEEEECNWNCIQDRTKHTQGVDRIVEYGSSLISLIQNQSRRKTVMKKRKLRRKKLKKTEGRFA